MNEFLGWIFYLGLFGVGLMVLLFGLQIVVMIGAIIFAGIAAVWNWAAKQFK